MTVDVHKAKRSESSPRLSDLVGEKGLGLLQMLPPLIVQVYQGCKNLSEGLDGARIHIQYGDYVISMDIVGTK